MSKDSVINISLKKKIQSLSTEREKIDAELASKEQKIKSDFSLQIIDILKSILAESSDADLDTLEANKSRLKEVSGYIAQASLGKKEKTVLTSSVTKVEKFISKKISEKNSILKKASEIVGGWTENAGSMVENAMSTAFANDPLVNFATKGLVKTGGFFKNAISKKIASRASQKDIKNSGIKSDAASLLGKSVKPNKPKMPPPGAPAGEDTDDTPSGGKTEGSNSLDRVENILQSISIDVKSLISLPQMIPDIQQTLISAETILSTISYDVQSSISLLQDLVEEMSYANMERDREANRSRFSPNKANAALKPDDDKKGGSFLAGVFGELAEGGVAGLVKGMLPRVAGGLAFLGGLATNPIVWIVGSLIWSAIDGINGYLKSGEWGVSKTSGTIGAIFGGTGKGVMNAVAQGGKWALMGAGIGMMTAGPIGAAIGGLIGALVGGVAGYIGGQKIAEFLDDFGRYIRNMFTNGVTVIKNFFLDMWDSIKTIFFDVNDAIDSVKMQALNWINQLVIDIMELDKSGLSHKYLAPVSQNLNEAQKNIGDKIAARQEERKRMAIEKIARDEQFAVQQQNQFDEQVSVESDRYDRRKKEKQQAQEQPSSPGFPKQIKVEPKSSAPVGDVQLDRPSPMLSEDSMGAPLKIKLDNGKTELQTEGTFRGQAFAGGKTHPGTISLARNIQSALGNDLIQFTGFNDSFHKSRKSFHNKGLALDFTIKSGKKGAGATKRRLMDIMRQAGVQGTVLDEYNFPSSHATAPHIHVNFASQADAQKFLTYSRTATSSNRPAANQTQLISPNPVASPVLSAQPPTSQSVQNQIAVNPAPRMSPVPEMSAQQATQLATPVVIVNNVVDASTNNSGNSVSSGKNSGGGAGAPVPPTRTPSAMTNRI